MLFVTLVLNSGPFPPPELPGFCGTSSLSVTLVGPACPSRESGWRTHSPHRKGLPVLLTSPVCRHAAANTPVGPLGLIARGTAYSNRFPVPSGGGLPLPNAGSASTLVLSRPAQRSLAVTACRLAESPKRPVCLEGSDGFVSSPRRFDSYRLERPRCRVGFAPTEDQHLSHGAH